MPKVTSLDQLLVTCLQDLRKGEELTLERFPSIAKAVTDPTTQTALRRRLSDARDRATEEDRLGEKMGVQACGEENQWMAGMLDDAEGDMKTEEPGPLLDIALIGAVRKMVNASLVSYETAMAVSARLGNQAAQKVFTSAREQEAEAEVALREALFRLTAQG